ncbi:SDR family oxidoreductase [Bradyrhizobium cajani]|uniref:NAD(P)H-binding protein n=1 Tax=Bradyrhizobium cajani TaxID=1928661 RepID=A0A844TN56_9BRAD|nr:SDR family oxidoreductase [Bradyrhizobium cajani]MCP3368183.1 SDR family oxidoreductase [Bradyrhizobium cajani]MVT76732.1 NAD(P)H-binding protein [Bradyrhizobium cajani]
MRVGVSGASGKLGQAVVAELIARGGGHQLVGISRTPESVQGRIEARLGDYDHPDTLVRAYTGLDRLLIIPSSELQPGVRGKQLTAAIDAARRAGVGHVFLVSAAGTHEEKGHGLGEAYWMGEQHLIKTAAHWTILRMNYYSQSMAEEIQMSLGQGMLAGLGDERVAYVSRDDLAAAAAGALLGEGHAGAIYNLTGPATISGAERAKLVADILRKPFSYAAITEAQLRAGLSQAGLPDLIIEAMAEIKRTFVQGKFDIVTGDVERLSGRPPKSLRDILAQQLS